MATDILVTGAGGFVRLEARFGPGPPLESVRADGLGFRNGGDLASLAQSTWRTK